jgi:hypothetical protein
MIIIKDEKEYKNILKMFIDKSIISILDEEFFIESFECRKDGKLYISIKQLIEIHKRPNLPIS